MPLVYHFKQSKNRNTQTKSRQSSTHAQRVHPTLTRASGPGILQEPTKYDNLLANDESAHLSKKNLEDCVVLDGQLLQDAVEEVDSLRHRTPVGFAHLCPKLAQQDPDFYT